MTTNRINLGIDLKTKGHPKLRVKSIQAPVELIYQILDGVSLSVSGNIQLNQASSAHPLNIFGDLNLDARIDPTVVEGNVVIRESSLELKRKD